MFWNFKSHTQFQGALVLIIGAGLLLQRGAVSRAEREAESVFTSAAEPLPVPPALRRAAGVSRAAAHQQHPGGRRVPCLPGHHPPRQLSLGITVVAYMVIGLSLLVLSGWAGQVSLGQLALAAVGAYVVAIAAASWHLPMPLALLLGSLAGALIAPLVGLPALRLPGPFVAIMTLAFALAVPAVLLNPDLLGDAPSPPTSSARCCSASTSAATATSTGSRCSSCSARSRVVTGLRRSRLRRALIAARDNAAGRRRPSAST